jgi:radical S-adenosyl methionine domain-containing protein 2
MDVGYGSRLHTQTVAVTAHAQTMISQKILLLLVSLVCHSMAIESSRFDTISRGIQRASKTKVHFGDLAVNFFFTRKCNYACKFCFHTSKSSYVLQLDDQLELISRLRLSGVAKINFAGGEPFLTQYHKMLGEMVKHSKTVGFESVSIISNGSQLDPAWFDEYGSYLDVLGISCDSAVALTNLAIGRASGRHEDQVENIRRASKICSAYGVKFKMNTVVCSHNKLEDITQLVNELSPMRWKVFQVLPLDGENTGANALRNVDDLLISDEEFEQYLERNRRGLRDISIMKAESNKVMQSSYLLVDEYGRFLDCSSGGKIPTKSILEVGVEAAYEELISSQGGGFDRTAYYDRDGYYPDGWSRD